MYKTSATFILLVTLLATDVSSQVNSRRDCDPLLATSLQEPLAYRQRQGRCEGIYIKPRSGSPSLGLVSFMDVRPPPTPNPSLTIRLTWPTAGLVAVDGGIHLRAASLREDVYYQMDTFRPIQEQTFSWPTDVISHLPLVPQDIGIVGSMKVLLAGVEWKVYLPVSASWAHSPKNLMSFELVLIPTVNLNGLDLWIAAIEADGLPGDRVRVWRPEQGAYPAYRPIRVTAPVPEKAGFYYLEAISTLPGGSRVNIAPSTSFAVYVGSP